MYNLFKNQKVLIDANIEFKTIIIDSTKYVACEKSVESCSNLFKRCKKHFVCDVTSISTNNTNATNHDASRNTNHDTSRNTNHDTCHDKKNNSSEIIN